MSNTSKSAFMILTICCLIYILSGFQRLCPNILAGYLTADFDLTKAQLGLLSSTTMLAYGLLQLPSGILADALGGKKALILLLVLSSLGAVWFGVTDSFNSAIVSRFLVGAGAAVTVPCMVILASVFPANVFGRVNSIFLCTGGLGGLLAASPLAYACEIFGWRLPIIFAGLLTLLLALTVFFLFKENKAEQEVEKVSLKNMLLNIKIVLTSKAFWPLALWSASVVSLFFLFAGLWWGPYLIQANHIDPMQASLLISFGSVVWIFGQPILGFASDYIKKRRIILILGTCSVLCAALSMLFFTGKLSVPLLMLQGVIFILGTNTATVMFTMLKESFPPHLMGTAIGCANCLYPISAALLQNIYGSVLDWRLGTHAGNAAAAFTDASWVYIIPCSIGLVMAFLTKETYKETN